MILRAEGNQLFLDNEEVRESACAREGGPAHYQRIAAVGSSPKGTRIVSVDEGGQLKVWDPGRRNMERRVWNGQGFGGATAVGVTDDGKRLAVAIGLVVTIYDVEPNVREFRRLESATLPLAEKVVFLQFTDDDHVMCSDTGGKKVIFERDPAWKVRGAEA